MRILVVTSGQAWFGGIATHAALVSRELHGRGHDVRVLSIGAPSPTDSMPWEVVDDVSGAPPNAPGDEYVFRHQVIAGAIGYAIPMPSSVARWVTQAAQRVSSMATADAVVPSPGVLGRVSAMVGAGVWEAAERALLERLLLAPHAHDLAGLDRVRARFEADVEYLTDLALVPMVSQVPRRRERMFAAAQGFELVVRRGVPLLPALRASRDRIDGIISGSTSNLTANLEPWWGDLGGPIPVDVVPYGPADGPEWHIGRSRAVAVLREAVPRTFADLREGDLPSRFVIAWLSRVDVEKGADLALHVLAILRAQGVDAELWVAGSGMPGSAYEAILATKVRVLDLGGYVRWVGALPSQAVKGAFLRAADAFIATFVRPEPFGLVVAEAMACGLPVVVPDTGGPGEVLRNAGLDPLTYPENDTGAAAQRLARLAHDRTWRRTAGETARAAFESRWNASRTGEALERVFQRASAESQRGGVVEKKPAHERRRGAHGPVWSSD